MVLRDDGLFVNVGEGAISLSNNVGLLVVTAGGAAFVANANTAPVPTNEQPHTPPAGLQEPTFTVSDNRNSTGGLAVMPVLASGSGFALSYAYTATSVSNALPLNGSVLLPSVAAAFSGSSQLTQYTGLQEAGSLGSALVSFSATDGIIGWGRWVGNTAGTGIGPNPMTATSFDYVVGIPTAAMPTTGTATYRLMGYTSPTATDGSNITNKYTVSGTLGVTFGVATVPTSIAVNMTVANSVANTFAINGSLSTPAGTATFTGPVTTTGTGCGSGCSTAINGFFAGTNASRAGLSYSINSGFGAGPANNIQGVAAFAKN